jgi:hypothetical protein
MKQFHSITPEINRKIPIICWSFPCILGQFNGSIAGNKRERGDDK